MAEDDRPFVVLKFLTHEGKRLTSDDDVFYAVGLTRWFTTELDENMEVQIKWPPTSVDAGSLVRKEKPPAPNWGEETVLIKRFYDIHEVSASSSKKDFNLSSKLKESKPLPSLPCPALGETSSFSDKSHANDHCLFQSGTSEKSGSSGASSQSKKTDISLSDPSTYDIKKELRQLNSKLDICLMNQEKLNRYILPSEKVIKRPRGFLSLPVQSEQELHDLETFLANDENLSAASMYLGRFVDKNSLESSVRKLLRNILNNNVANKFSFQGAKGKQKFDVLKIWELILGALLLYFEAEDMAVAEKVASSWLANAPWRAQTDGTIRSKKFKKTE